LIAPLAIYILFNLAYSFKGFVIDTDPGNVFFWLVLGLMLRLDRDLRASHGQPSELTLDLPRIPVALDPGSPSSPL
jgi:hypothetical protein